ncbi:MAG: FAD-dependent oxidoreductase [Candidatus Neomarinimicrobiota bacterium]
MILKENYDFIIVGSGFGGSVSALRLAEKGYSVLVIEKGKQFSGKDFPKTNWNLRKWLWLPVLKLFGIQKIHFFRHITVLSGIGVGGGSLVYANTLPKPKQEFYKQGSWAGLENWEKILAPFYNIAWKMLGAAVNPRLEESDLALEELARQMKKEKNFFPTTVGVYFGEPEKTVKDPYFEGKGPDRTGCIFCGSCLTGCRHNAKNTLDKNYLYLARKLGVDVLPENEVMDITALDKKNGSTGYSVTYKKSTAYFSKNQKLQSKGIIFAGGVLGTIPLLLKLKKTSLPNLSPRVGSMVRTNSEALVQNVTLDKHRDMSKGIAIGSILEYDENSHIEPTKYGEKSGIWRLLALPMVYEKSFFKRIIKLFGLLIKEPLQWLKIFFVDDFSKRSSILVFMQHLESTLDFKLGFLGMKSRISNGQAPTAFIPEAKAVVDKYSEIINSKPMVAFTETLAGIPTTAHILGGAVMAANPDEGVISRDNKVFGYEHMYVFDGSMISANPGVNPSLSITAISERGMSLIKPKIP